MCVAHRRQSGCFCRRLPHGDLGVQCRPSLDDPEKQQQQNWQRQSQFDQDGTAFTFLAA